jgi:hypothetical protein
MVAQKPVVHEILVLTDYDSVLKSGAIPHHRIISGLQTDIEYMRGLMACVIIQRANAGGSCASIRKVTLVAKPCDRPGVPRKRAPL